MKSFLCCIGLVAVAVLTSAACGDSDTPPTGGGGAGGTGGSGGSGASDGGQTCATPDAGKSNTVGCVTINECDKVTYTGTMPPAYTCNGSKSTSYPDGPNACRNESDCAIINTGMVREIVRGIALGCRSSFPDPEPGIPEADRIAACQKQADCNTADVKKITAMKIMPPGISDACGQCYTGIALCSIAYCVMECVANADAIECVKCQFDAGCRTVYERCSGLDR